MHIVKIEQFEGPFDLLLKLIEKEKLDITEISLAKVTDEFLDYLTKIKEVSLEELADFLEIAAKLLLIKSRLLIPEAFEDEEGSDDLVERLKIYRQFLLISKKIGRMVASPHYSFMKDRIPLKNMPNLTINIKVTPEMLEKSFKNILNIMLSQIKPVQKTLRRKVISLKEKLNELIKLIKTQEEFILNNLIKNKERMEKVVMFLAVLELVKGKMVMVTQKGLFENIVVKKI